MLDVNTAAKRKQIGGGGGNFHLDASAFFVL